jgi:hypothetical protein
MVWAKVDLVVLGQKGVLANVGEVETYEVLIVTIDAIFRHGFPSVPTRRIRYY